MAKKKRKNGRTRTRTAQSCPAQTDAESILDQAVAYGLREFMPEFRRRVEPPHDAKVEAFMEQIAINIARQIVPDFSAELGGDLEAHGLLVLADEVAPDQFDCRGVKKEVAACDRSLWRAQFEGRVKVVNHLKPDALVVVRFLSRRSEHGPLSTFPSLGGEA